MALISAEVQKQVRMRDTERLELEPYIGVKLAILVGAPPLAEQHSLARFTKASKRLQKSRDDEGQMDADALKEMTDATRSLVASSCLTEQGDRLTVSDADQLFDLLPSGAEGVEFMTTLVTRVSMFSKHKGGQPPVSEKVIEGEVSGKT